MVGDGCVCCSGVRRMMLNVGLKMLYISLDKTVLSYNQILPLNLTGQDSPKYPKNDLMIADKILFGEYLFEIVHKFDSFNLNEL